MSKAVEKKTSEIQEFKNGLAKLNINVGDLFIDSDGRLIRISEIDMKDKYIHTECEYNDGWSSWGSSRVNEFESKDYIKLEKPYEEYEKEAVNALGNLEELRFSREIPETTALVKVGSEKNLVAVQSALDIQESKVAIFARIIRRKLDALSSIRHELSTQLAKVQKVIGILELYLGVREEIMQIQEGMPASIAEPISFRQMILFMDEEVGDPSQGGLDFQSIEEFDNWVTSKEHYKKLVPEEKCVVVMKPRRFNKSYGLGAFMDAFYNAENKVTYILIRNGENLYRIYSGLDISPSFFPSKKGMNKLFNIIDGKVKEKWGSDIDDAREQLLEYKKHLIVMQGLVERTEILHPLPVGFSFANQKMYEKHIRFIYDEDPSLTEGKETYKDWRKRINKYIKRGTRILFTGFTSEVLHGQYHERNTRFPHYVSVYPGTGVYSVKKILPETKFREERIVCHYNPGDEVWHGSSWRRGGYRGGEYVERKKAIPFNLYAYDEFVLNYDMIDLDSVERFLTDRHDRKNYLSMMPILYGLKKNRLKEYEKEKSLVKLISQRLKVKEGKVWIAVRWWKTKNIWKRPIMEDDAKALRMIERKLKRFTKD